MKGFWCNLPGHHHPNELGDFVESDSPEQAVIALCERRYGELAKAEQLEPEQWQIIKVEDGQGRVWRIKATGRMKVEWEAAEV